MTKYLRFEQARESKVYREIVDECCYRLAEVGYFSKADVMDKTGYGAIDVEDIRWDYVKRIIEKEQSTELICLPSAFFKRHPKTEEVRFPARYLAHGHGKRAVGFAIVSRENGHLVMQHLNLKRAKAIGHVRSANETLDMSRRALVDGSEIAALPSNE
jgi:hypothetical protein